MMEHMLLDFRKENGTGMKRDVYDIEAPILQKTSPLWGGLFPYYEYHLDGATCKISYKPQKNLA